MLSNLQNIYSTKKKNPYGSAIKRRIKMRQQQRSTVVQNLDNDHDYRNEESNITKHRKGMGF